MPKVNGGQKGATFERDISRRLSLWLSFGHNPNLLWRSAGSGSRSTRFAKKTGGQGIDNQASDLAPIHDDAKILTDRYIIECKAYKAVSFAQLFFDPNGTVIARWWRTAYRDAESVGKKPILIIKSNNAPIMLCTFPPPGIESERYYLDGCVFIKELGMEVYRLDHVLSVSPYLFLDIDKPDLVKVRPVTRAKIKK